MPVRTLRFQVPARIALLIAAAGCLRVDTTAPPCTGSIQIEAPVSVIVGQTFTATAAHNAEGCLNGLAWRAEGALDIVEVNAEGAQIQAVEPGIGTITVINPHGNTGVAEVEVDEAEEGGQLRALP